MSVPDEVENLGVVEEEPTEEEGEEIVEEPKQTEDLEVIPTEEEQTVDVPEIPIEKPQVISEKDFVLFQGKPVIYSEIRSSPIDVAPSSIFSPGILNVQTHGILDSFLVSCNDSKFKVFCRIRDHKNHSRVIVNHTVDELGNIGAGMTTGELNGDVTSSAFDPVGVRDPEDVYIARGKNQYTGTETEYEKLVGTPDDKYLVLKYNPDTKLEFFSLEFHIENTEVAGARRVHKYEIRYFDIDRDITNVPQDELKAEDIEKNDIEIELNSEDADDVIEKIINEDAEDQGTPLKLKEETDIDIEATDEVAADPINVA
ncbi:MAG: hypothetical protein R3321_01135 [Nitrososphaeraceae archaeon]|nr:hypothetical protein [Nitrososphaeraceae archaeon]